MTITTNQATQAIVTKIVELSSHSLKSSFDKETKAAVLFTAEQIADRKHVLAVIDRDMADARIRANVNRHFSK